MFCYKSVIFSVLILLKVVSGMPQFITFDNGKIGVNFAGYHAEAGLGGLLTGNAAHGGLSASAGTPFGQKAGAGLGGTVIEGRTAGGLYAGASSGYGQGASAALGGKVDGAGSSGGLGAESHAGGVSKKVVSLGQGPVVKEIHSVQYPSAGANVGVATNTRTKVNTRVDTVVENDTPVYTKTVQKTKTRVRPHKKVTIVEETHHTAPHPSQEFDYKNFLDFGFFSNAAAYYGGDHVPGNKQIIVEKTYVPPTVEKEVIVNRYDSTHHAHPVAPHGTATRTTLTANHGGSFFNDIFNIPISTLQAVNAFLNNAGGGVTKTKTVTTY